jgi:hypothetical protein
VSKIFRVKIFVRFLIVLLVCAVLLRASKLTVVV